MEFFVLVILFKVSAQLTPTYGCGGCDGNQITDTVCNTGTATGTGPGTGTGTGTGTGIGTGADTDTDRGTGPVWMSGTREVTRTRLVGCRQVYSCPVWRRFGGWVFTIQRRCYRSGYCTVAETIEVPMETQPDPSTPDTGTQQTHDYPCCDGYIQTSKDECTRCGRSKYSPPALPGGIITYIVGGVNAQVNQFPWLVRLTTRYADHYSTCGGTIINKRYILTAAHCVYGSYASYSRATVGDHDQLSSAVGTNEKAYTYAKVYTHPYYSPSHGVSDYDIALVQTTQDIQFNDDVQPACLPRESRSYLGEEVTVAGWGRTDGASSGSQSRTLRQTTATVINSYYCGRYVNVICARGVRNNVCSGDSGGPMMHVTSGYTSVIGVSWWSTIGCPAGAQFGFSDVTKYLDWIRRTVQF